MELNGVKMNMERLDIQFDSGSLIGFWTLGFSFSGYVCKAAVCSYREDYSFIRPLKVTAGLSV